MSEPRKSRSLPPLVLSLICMGLAGAVYRQAEGLRSLPDPPAPAAAVMMKRDSVPLESSLSVPPRETYSEVVARPIFSPTRRPAVAAAEVAVPAVSEPLDADLVGVVIWPSQRLALVRPNSGDRVLQVPEGGAVSGWIVVTIEPGRIVLGQGGSEREHHLTYKAAKDNK